MLFYSFTFSNLFLSKDSFYGDKEDDCCFRNFKKRPRNRKWNVDGDYDKYEKFEYKHKKSKDKNRKRH